MAVETEVRRRALRTEEMAWIAAVPCALLAAGLAYLLGPPLGERFMGPGDDVFWAPILVSPEPAEHGRYLLALLGPALLVAAVLLGARRRPPASRLDHRWAYAAQAALVAFVLLCLAVQNDLLADVRWPTETRYFTATTLAVALVLALLLLVASSRHDLVARVAALVRETPPRRAIGTGIAALFTALWLSTAVNTDGSVSLAAPLLVIHVPWSMAEPFAILDGRTPLVDFHAQYGQLWPYVSAGAMALFGASTGVYTIAMAVCSGLALLAIYAVLRRIVQSSAVALALYLPFVATGFFMKIGPLDDRYGPASLVSLWPVRYGGPYLLLWLAARHVGGVAPRRLWALFLAAGLVLINNPEFGAAACAGVVAALLATRPPATWATAGRLLAQAAGGLLGAVALVTLLTVLRSGSLPDFGLALEFSRLYGVDGWDLLPLPGIGLYLVVYVTFAAAVAVATVRAVRGAADAVLTGALMWSGVFGLVVGGYFVGRSHPHVLIDLFSPWALSLVLLTIAAVRALRGPQRSAVRVPALLALFGFGLLVCSLAQTPTPWSQAERIGERDTAQLLEYREIADFVRAETRPGEKVALLTPLGHRIAYETGRENVSPYASTQSIATVAQLERTIAQLRGEGGTKVLLSTTYSFPEQIQLLTNAGFRMRVRTQESQGGEVALLVDGG